MGALTARTQRDVEIDRAIAGRCPKCGSRRTEAGGTLVILGESQEYGVRCRACGYWKDGVGVVHERPFITPGSKGSHDRESDYQGMCRE